MWGLEINKKTFSGRYNRHTTHKFIYQAVSSDQRINSQHESLKNMPGQDNTFMFKTSHDEWIY